MLLVNYFLIGVYGFLVLLALRNIWVVVIKQRERKNLPILMFYVFSLIAVALRLVYLIWFWSKELPYSVDETQQAAKLCVGIIQDWITIELAIRIRNAKGSSDVPELVKKKLCICRRSLFTILTLAFVTFCVIFIVSAHKKEEF